MNRTLLRVDRWGSDFLCISVAEDMQQESEMEPSHTPQSSGSNERRRAGRLFCRGTRCQFGEVLDLSSKGARVVSKKPITIPDGATVNLRLEHEAGCLFVPARPVACRKRPDKGYDVGFEFQFIGEDMTRQLIAFARSALNNSQYKSRSA